MSHPAPGQLRQVTEFAAVLLAHNPGPMTLDGTNTWLLGTGRERVVVDPGPGESAHLRQVAEQAEVPLVLLTHHHFDHTEGVEEFVERSGAVVMTDRKSGSAVPRRGAVPGRRGRRGRRGAADRAGHPRPHQGLGVLPRGARRQT